MNGSVVKKGGRWYVKIELDPDPSTGRRRQKWHSGFQTRREAERARIDLLSRRDRGVYVEPSRQTVGEYLSEWLEAIRPTIRQSTFDSYSRNLRLHVAPRIGRVHLSQLDAGILNRLYADLLLAGRQPPSRQGAGYSPAVLARAQELRALGYSLSATAKALRGEDPEAHNLSKDTLASLLRREQARQRAPAARPAGLDPRTVAYIHSIVHRALKDAVRWDRLARNPADAAEPPRASWRESAAAAWDSDTLRRFLVDSKDSGDRFYPLWVLLATTGMRRGEALGLRWCDVDLEAGRLRIVQTLLQTKSTVEVGLPKTSHGRRSVSLDRTTVTVLRAHRARMLQDRLLALALAAARGLSHAEFLELLLADESTRRDTHSAALRARAAGLDPAMRFEHWDDTAAGQLRPGRPRRARLPTLRRHRPQPPDPRTRRSRQNLHRHRPRPPRHPPTDQRALRAHRPTRQTTQGLPARQQPTTPSCASSSASTCSSSTTTASPPSTPPTPPTSTSSSSNATAGPPPSSPPTASPVEWLGLMADPLLAQSAIDRLQSAAHELILGGDSYRRRQKPTTAATPDQPHPAPRRRRT